MVGPSEQCEPLPGSATCSAPEKCKVCGFLLTTSGKPDPNAHNWKLRSIPGIILAKIVKPAYLFMTALLFANA